MYLNNWSLLKCDSTFEPVLPPAGTPLAQPVVLSSSLAGRLKQVPACCSVTAQMAGACGTGQMQMTRGLFSADVALTPHWRRAGEARSPSTSAVRCGLWARGRWGPWVRPSTGQVGSYNRELTGLVQSPPALSSATKFMKRESEAVCPGFCYDS